MIYFVSQRENPEHGGFQEASVLQVFLSAGIDLPNRRTFDALNKRLELFVGVLEMQRWASFTMFPVCSCLLVCWLLLYSCMWFIRYNKFWMYPQKDVGLFFLLQSVDPDCFNPSSLKVKSAWLHVYPCCPLVLTSSWLLLLMGDKTFSWGGWINQSLLKVGYFMMKNIWHYPLQPCCLIWCFSEVWWRSHPLLHHGDKEDSLPLGLQTAQRCDVNLHNNPKANSWADC